MIAWDGMLLDGWVLSPISVQAVINIRYLRCRHAATATIGTRPRSDARLAQQLLLFEAKARSPVRATC